VSRSRRRIRRRLPAPAELAVDPQILKAHGEGHPGGGQGQGDQGADGDLIGYGRDATNADPLLEYLLGFRERMGQARRLLTDAERTAFFFVTLPEALPIAVISRFIGWFHEFGIPVGGVIVNMVLDRQALGDDMPEFVRNRVGMQGEHLRTIRDKFGDGVRAVVPLFDQEVRGTAMLAPAAGALFD